MSIYTLMINSEHKVVTQAISREIDIERITKLGGILISDYQNADKIAFDSTIKNGKNIGRPAYSKFDAYIPDTLPSWGGFLTRKEALFQLDTTTQHVILKLLTDAMLEHDLPHAAQLGSRWPNLHALPTYNNGGGTSCLRFKFYDLDIVISNREGLDYKFLKDDWMACVYKNFDQAEQPLLCLNDND